MKEYKLHEIANLFPLLSDEKLKEIADDIRINGLKNPFILLYNKK
jgi:hypothetical protein